MAVAQASTTRRNSARDGAPPVPIRLFGSFRVGHPGLELGPRDLGGAQPKRLLQVLVLERGRVVSKDALAARLWPGRVPNDPVATLETYVSVLRRRVPNGGLVINTEPQGYRVAPGQVAVDLDEFDRLVQLGAEGHPGDRRVHLDAAVDLAGDSVLADEPRADWAQPVRRQYAERRRQALIDLAECSLVIGDLDEAAEAAIRVLAEDQVSERAARVAMLALYARGSGVEALRIYGQLRHQLGAELGVIPESSTLALHTAIVKREPVDVVLSAHGPSQPPIHFASNGSVRLAYQVVGGGSPTIVFAPPFVTHVAAIWDEPVYAGFLRALAGIGRLVIFDKRGTGLSDPVTEWPAETQRGDDLGAVLDAAGARDAVLFGVCDGGALCVRYAVRHPDRVSALVLAGVPARWLAADDFPWGWSDRFHGAFLRSLEEAWSSARGLENINPSVASDPRYRALFARCLRLGASPGASRHLAEFNRDDDLRPLLPMIQVPTLVLSRSDDPWVHVENSRYIASHVPGATLVELPGADHEPWVGDSDAVLDQVRRFIADVSTTGPGRQGVKR